LGPVLFNIFIKGLDDGAEGTLSKFADNVKLGRLADMPESCAALQKALNRLEKWSKRNLTKSNKGKGKLLHMGKNNLVD